MKEKENEPIVRSKEVFYRGKSLELLKDLEVRESVKFLPSRARRYVLRNFDIVEKFIKKCEKYNTKKKKIKTQRREIVIVPKLVGMTVSVYNGKSFNDVHLTAEMIGHRLGEFSPTTGKVAHSAAGIGATKSSRALKK